MIEKPTEQHDSSSTLLFQTPLRNPVSSIPQGNHLRICNRNEYINFNNDESRLCKPMFSI